MQALVVNYDASFVFIHFLLPGIFKFSSDILFHFLQCTLVKARRSINMASFYFVFRLRFRCKLADNVRFTCNVCICITHSHFSSTVL